MSTVLSASKRLARQPSFLVAFAVLLLAAVGLNAATQYLQLHFKKLPVPLAHKLDTIPDVLGTWINVMKDQLSDDVQQELGTEQYVMRYYVNSLVVSPTEIEEFHGKDYKHQLELLGKLRQKYRNRGERAILSFAVTYYTGKADTVAHIPERCYTADGYEATDAKTERWDVRSPHTADGNLDVRYINFEDQSGAEHVQRNVAYLFHVNGKYTPSSTEVRLALQNLRQKYGYYAKVELMIQEKDKDEAAASMRDFLSYALPEVEKCMPDWSKLPQ
jgi:hypothetical protein